MHVAGPDPGDGPAEPVDEQRPVGQAGELVDQHAVGQLLLVGPLIGDVPDEGPEAGRPVHDDHDDGELDGERPPVPVLDDQLDATGRHVPVAEGAQGLDPLLVERSVLPEEDAVGQPLAQDLRRGPAEHRLGGRVPVRHPTVAVGAHEGIGDRLKRLPVHDGRLGLLGHGEHRLGDVDRRAPQRDGHTELVADDPALAAQPGDPVVVADPVLVGERGPHRRRGLEEEVPVLLDDQVEEVGERRGLAHRVDAVDHRGVVPHGEDPAGQVQLPHREVTGLEGQVQALALLGDRALRLTFLGDVGDGPERADHLAVRAEHGRRGDVDVHRAPVGPHHADDEVLGDPGPEVVDDGHGLGHVGVGHEVVDRRRLEDAEVTAEEVGEVLVGEGRLSDEVDHPDAVVGGVHDAPEPGLVDGQLGFGELAVDGVERQADDADQVAVRRADRSADHEGVEGRPVLAHDREGAGPLLAPVEADPDLVGERPGPGVDHDLTGRSTDDFGGLPAVHRLGQTAPQDDPALHVEDDDGHGEGRNRLVERLRPRDDIEERCRIRVLHLPPSARPALM